MRWFTSLAVLMLVVRSLAPCCFVDWADPSHAHMFLGGVSRVVFGQPHSAMPGHALSAPAAPIFDNGMPLFFPSSDWQTFLADFFLAAFSHATWLLIPLFLLMRLARQEVFPRLARAWLFDPPPRRAVI